MQTIKDLKIGCGCGCTSLYLCSRCENLVKQLQDICKIIEEFYIDKVEEQHSISSRGFHMTKEDLEKLLLKIKGEIK